LPAGTPAPLISDHELVVLERPYQLSLEEQVVKYYIDLKRIDDASLEDEFRGMDWPPVHLEAESNTKTQSLQEIIKTFLTALHRLR
jgi:hypothetical protein